MRPRLPRRARKCCAARGGFRFARRGILGGWVFALPVSHAPLVCVGLPGLVRFAGWLAAGDFQKKRGGALEHARLQVESDLPPLFSRKSLLSLKNPGPVSFQLRYTRYKSSAGWTPNLASPSAAAGVSSLQHRLVPLPSHVSPEAEGSENLSFFF